MMEFDDAEGNGEHITPWKGISQGSDGPPLSRVPSGLEYEAEHDRPAHRRYPRLGGQRQRTQNGALSPRIRKPPYLYAPQTPRRPRLQRIQPHLSSPLPTRTTTNGCRWSASPKATR